MGVHCLPTLATALRLLVPMLLIAGVHQGPVVIAQHAATRDTTSSVEARRGGVVLFPGGDFFQSLSADPKEIGTFGGLRRGDASVFDTVFFVGGLGQRLGLLRYRGIQISGSGGIFVQFDVLADSFDLLNTDFVIGLPISFRAGPVTGRLRPYHQSSHLGDELLLRDPPVRRLNYSYESIELIVSVQRRGLRLYGGGEFVADREYGDQSPSGVLRGGAEIRSRSRSLRLGPWGRTRLFGAADVRSFEEVEWKTGVSVRCGLEAELRRPGLFAPRLWRLLLEYDGGLSPYGQFYDLPLRQLGAALHLGL